MVKVRVDDADESNNFILFDNKIEKLFSTSTTSLLKAQGNDSKTIQERLLDLVGMTFIFQIKMTNYELYKPT